MVRWNSTLTSMAGSIGLGGTVRMEVPEAPGTVFEIEVTTFIPPRELTCTQGKPDRLPRITKFEMIEVFSGLALPMAAGRLPDFKPIFERYGPISRRRRSATDELPGRDESVGT